ncbi:MAG TPA: AAA family ATPase [Thermomicrobiales bacterium]|nr:AAA family ATPase [Thermomicrobiales bacterium]
MSTHPSAATLHQLKESGYRPVSVRDEMRKNLIASLRSGERLFAGIHGYEDTVIPQIENAILAGHDIILLGERGQAKTRLARSLVQLLDAWIPIVAGSEINDDPFQPVSAFARRVVADQGDDTPIEWMPRDRRFAEKLATPDTTIADLIGEVDPIKVAEGRYLSNEEVIAFGLIPRTNRGIFNLNELPDLAERIQVGLLNILEEEDVQIRGFQVRLPLDVMVVASANPEDYTNRGRIITPLKDRFGSQIRTHYPETIADELTIVEQERTGFTVDGVAVNVPQFMQDIVAEISRAARHSPDVSQRSGVSVRMTITNFEAMVANAQRRALLLGEGHAAPRISDLAAIYPSTMGKVEFETFGEGRDDQVVDRIVGDAIRMVYAREVDPSRLTSLLTAFDNGLAVDASDEAGSYSYIHQVSAVEGVSEIIEGLGAGKDPASIASAVEFLLEGLHRNRKLSKRITGEGAHYAR